MIDFTDPSTIAFLNFLGLGFLGVIGAFGHWYGKRKDAAPTTTKDVMVPSVTIADRVAIEQMAETLRDASRIARDQRQHDTEILYELRMLNSTMSRMENCMSRLIDHLPDRENGPRLLSLLGRMFDHQRGRAEIRD